MPVRQYKIIGDLHASHFYRGGYPSAELTLLFSLELMQRDNARFHMKPGIPWLAPALPRSATFLDLANSLRIPGAAPGGLRFSSR